MSIAPQREMLAPGFLVSRAAREHYGFSPALLTSRGNAYFPTFHAARKFAQAMNAQRDLLTAPERTVRAGQINAMGLIDEILHYVVQLYTQEHPAVMADALVWIRERVGGTALEEALRQFVTQFPPAPVFSGQQDAAAYLDGATDGVSHRELALQEFIALWLANMNTAYEPYGDLFDDAPLADDTAYLQIIDELQTYFAQHPPYGPEQQPLIDMLRSPALAVPHSLAGQLEYILAHWSGLLGKYLFRLLGSLDLIKEEEKAIFFGPGPSVVYDYTGLEQEPERFSQDKDWMPCLVLMAKNAYVWLDQLSKKYDRPITKLDQIPDEELDRLARGGFSGLWLIGLWERSTASKLIKQWCGNPEAEASAYSLKRYDPADDLGGDAALHNLRERAWQRGIRLASDMVPNHMGIDSQWLIDHPDWFVSLPYSPFPSYGFSGVSVSGDDRVGVYLEDHYFTRNDAAVVFKRVDHWTGDTRYVYHGNDGTSMPWNDTAQLNYLIPEVREAVIQTILHVARNFPVIRFDAAMTLAKKHYQRLWFPEPGTGGAIPSRAEHGMTKAQFDAVFPVEFWREVVDRVAAEAPDTLLLAEAFWLMEGYFVRTLGMHRVYNSAFMNMLRDEDNGKYRAVMRNTLEFDLDIMKRFVNFMNNPDERTAIDQFGDGDKYFGVCTVMCTLPGLPMFGHGQIEGFSEKYGMEYRKAYKDEEPNAGLVGRHEREIFPLLHRRHIFAEASNFLLYDFFTTDGHVNEDVFAYSNRAGDERGLVLYHNKFAATRGWVRMSVGYKDKANGQIVQRSLREGLSITNDGNRYLIFRDLATGLEYLRNSGELCERGMYVELDAYKYHVFVDFREVVDNEWQHYAHLAGYLNGRGVPSIDEALRELFLQPVHQAFTALVNADTFRGIRAGEVSPEAVETLLRDFFTVAKEYTGGTGDIEKLAHDARLRLVTWQKLPTYLAQNSTYGSDARKLFGIDTLNGARAWEVFLGWLAVHALGGMMDEDNPYEMSVSLLDEWLLGRQLAGALQGDGQTEGDAWRAVTAVRLLTRYQSWCQEAIRPDAAHTILAEWLQDPDVQRMLQVNRYQGVLYFNRESFELFLQWALRIAAVALYATNMLDADARLQVCYRVIRHLWLAGEESEYRVETLLKVAEGEMPAK